jgi:hypothetical protein
MAQKIKEKHTKVNSSICELWSTPKEIEYPNEFFMFIKNILFAFPFETFA